MVENISELQELIEWCKANGVKRLKMDEIEFELSDIALSEKFMDISNTQGASALKDRESNSLTSKTLTDTVDAAEQAKEDEELLFWSSRT